jgi:hypothetical protein
MRSDEYGRLHAAFLAMAEQTDSPEARARWFALALESRILAEKRPAAPKHLRDHLKSLRALLSARALICLYAVQDAASFLAESVSAEPLALALL